MVEDGLGGWITFTNVRDREGTLLTEPTYKAWTDGDKYQADQEVMTGADPNFKYWKCLRNHTATSSGATGEPTADNVYWVEVDKGTVMLLFGYNIRESVNSTTKQVIDEKGGARTIPQGETHTGSLTFGRLRNNEHQKLFKPGNHGLMKIMPDGRESGMEVWTFQADILDRDRGVTGGDTFEIPVSFGVDGAIDEGVLA